MKAKLTIGEMSVEVHGDPKEIAEVIAMQNEENHRKAGRRKPIQPHATLSSKKKVSRRSKHVKRPASRGRAAVTHWSEGEDAKLKAEYKAKKTIAEISKIIGRSKGAITQRIIKLRNKGEIG